MFLPTITKQRYKLIRITNARVEESVHFLLYHEGSRVDSPVKLCIRVVVFDLLYSVVFDLFFKFEYGLWCYLHTLTKPLTWLNNFNLFGDDGAFASILVLLTCSSIT